MCVTLYLRELKDKKTKNYPPGAKEHKKRRKEKKKRARSSIKGVFQSYGDDI